MQDSEDRPQRRLALVARELAQLHIDIVALSEVRFVEQGSFREDGAGYTLFWSGKNKNERRLSGVRFMIKTSIARKLQNLPVGHSDRIISLRLPIQDNKFATALSVYAPTLQTETGVKEAIYRDLHNLLLQNDPKDKLLILGDFNARVGRDFELWKGVISRHGIGKCIDTNLKVTMHFLHGCTYFPCAPTNFATYLPWAKKKKKIVSQERTLTTSMQGNLSTDKLKSDD